MPADAVILDPWNGAGTTTQLAREKGCLSIGFDINPAMVTVAKARLLHPNVRESLASLCVDVVRKADASAKRPIDVTEPLLRWLSPATSSAFRRIERAIEELLVDHPSPEPLARCESLDHISSLAAFFYTALFRATRRSLRKFQSSNPTWIKGAASPGDRIRLDDTIVFDSFKSSCLEMIADMKLDTSDHADTKCRIELASSTKLPLGDNTIHAVITSPPYCTRIDYAIATWPELAIMGATEEDVDALRRRMLGTTTVPRETSGVQKSWGATCLSTLERVTSHASKASKTYYRRNLIQYFDGLSRSCSEIARVLSTRGTLVLVVQDSYYKDVHIDLPAIVEEMAGKRGLVRKARQDFQIAQTRAAVNTRAKQYRAAASATESVLSFIKA